MRAQGVTPMQRASTGQAGNGQQPQAQPAQQPQQGNSNGNGNGNGTGDTNDGDGDGDGEQPSLEMELEAALDPNAESSDEHTSELQSLMRISYAVLCLKTKTEAADHTSPQ